MVRGRRATDVAVPPTIQALLAARLDQLDPAERGVLERGSIEGRVFHRGAVAGARAGRDAGASAADRARAQGARPARPGAASGRGRLPLPPPADPRRRLRRVAEGDARGPARALRGLARRSTEPTSSSSTRSSATTSSRRLGTAGAGHRRSRSGPGRAAGGWRRPADGRSSRDDVPGGGRAAGAGARARPGGRDRHRARDRPCRRPPTLRSWGDAYAATGDLVERSTAGGDRLRRAAGAHRAGDDGDVHRAGRRRRPAGGSARGGCADGRGLGRCFRALPRRPGAGR